jgi:site-specific recombinase XerD
MVQKDLKRAGISYETHEELADFHAAGRHSHITGLIASGASIIDAEELARHADIRQTAKYTISACGRDGPGWVAISQLMCTR